MTDYARNHAELPQARDALARDLSPRPYGSADRSMWSYWSFPEPYSIYCTAMVSRPANPVVNIRVCRVADLDWRLGRVYFLAFLNPSRGQPDPAPTARLASLCNRR
jgi:hypothetical protein